MKCIRCDKDETNDRNIRMFGFHFWLCGECLLFWYDTAFGNTKAAARTLAWLFFMVPDPTPIVSMLNHLVDRSFPTVDILGGD